MYKDSVWSETVRTQIEHHTDYIIEYIVHVYIKIYNKRAVFSDIASVIYMLLYFTGSPRTVQLAIPRPRFIPQYQVSYIYVLGKFVCLFSR